MIPLSLNTITDCKMQLRPIDKESSTRQVNASGKDVLSLSHRTEWTTEESTDCTVCSREKYEYFLPVQADEGESSTSSILKPHSLPLSIREEGPWKRLPNPDCSFIQKPRLSTRQHKKQERNVSFDSVNVRLYAQTLGDNPSVPCGPPIQLDWMYEEEPPIGIDEYEGTRRRRWIHPQQMALSYNQRQNILSYYYGHTMEEIKHASLLASKVRQQRNATNLIGKAFVIEEFLGSAARKTKRLITRKNK